MASVVSMRPLENILSQRQVSYYAVPFIISISAAFGDQYDFVDCRADQEVLVNQ